MKKELAAKPAYVIIPAYEPEEDFVSYAASLLHNPHINLIAVDDGSGEAFSHIFQEIAKLPRTTLLTHPENKGKGAAMKTAFRYCLENCPSDSVYTVADCDGQHTVPDVLRVMKKAQKHPDSLVLGVRTFSRKVVPFRSRFGNTIMAKLLEKRIGVALKDTQTGLRGFSHSLLSRMLEVEGDRFSYETAVLIELHEKGVLFYQVDIETVYRKQEETTQKVSHFRTISDSIDVLGVLFSQFGFYFISSVASALLDVLLFYLLSKFCFRSLDIAVRLLLATSIARVSSSVVNFFGNRYAFRGKGKRSFFRYYLLWTVQLSVSYGFTVLLGHFIFKAFWLSAAKAVFDIVLAFFSYQIQKRWVFAPKHNKTFYFYGPLLRIVRFFVRPFLPKYHATFSEPDEPTVYLCRHMNMQGPVAMASRMPFDTHFFALSIFFRFSTCFKQYRDYTFTARHSNSPMRKFFGTIAAFFAALFVPHLLRSMKMIPVHRGEGAMALKTLRGALACLEKGESVTIFPDVDYAMTDEGNHQIYNGFLVLDRMYQRKTGKKLPFCVVYLDTENKRIVEKETFVFAENVPYNEEYERMTADISASLFEQ